MDFGNIKYKNNFLKQVIIRLDFLNFVETEDLFDSIIIQKIMAKFPHKQKDQITRFNQIELNEESTVKKKMIEGMQQTYLSEEGNKLVLSNKHLVIDVSNYNTFENLLESIQQIIFDLFKRKSISSARTGLRYINVFNPQNIRIYKNYFSSVVAGSMYVLKSDDPNLHLARSLHLAEYSINEVKLNFRYGFYNRNYPSPITSWDFILDYDCFTTEGFSNSNEIMQFIIAGHDYIQSLYESSITNNLRKVMNNE